jgi:5'-phosphate synthase pdxT subunit
MKIGIIAIQGAVSEHVEIVDTALREQGKQGSAVMVRRPGHMRGISALIIPGGESTTIGKALDKNGLHEEIVKRALDGLPVMGTCAGCVLLAKEGDDEVAKTKTRLLSLMDMAVDRNAFGRQRESFESELEIDGIGEFHAVFIRAPVITRIWGRCKALARVKEGIVAAVQDNMLALSFHPELSRDSRLHRMLIGMV